MEGKEGKPTEVTPGHLLDVLTAWERDEIKKIDVVWFAQEALEHMLDAQYRDLPKTDPGFFSLEVVLQLEAMYELDIDKDDLPVLKSILRFGNDAPGRALGLLDDFLSDVDRRQKQRLAEGRAADGKAKP